MSAEPPQPLEIDCHALKARLDEGADLLLIDCRERDEYQIVRIQGARLLPMSEIADRLAELAEHRQRTIVVHCHHGQRSLRVARWLRQQGFAAAQSLAGGIDAWAQVVDPALPRY